jgi:hypothetical protein
MAAVLTGRLGDGASVRVTYPAGARFYLLGVQQQRAGAGRQLLAQRHGAQLASPISVSAETSHNERFGAPPTDLVERITTLQIGGSGRGLRSCCQLRSVTKVAAGIAVATRWPLVSALKEGRGAGLASGL